MATSRRPKASPLWEFLLYDEDSKCSKCIVKSRKDECGRIIKGKNPNNLKQHMSKSHSDSYAQLLEKEKKLKEKKTTDKGKNQS